MNPTVSIVMPCYNKEDYIGEMFDSILRQKWDNVELVLVNDGSTDGTRRVIAEYEPKFIARGYTCNVIDQANGGVCKAVKAGLLAATGDYISCIDADDLLTKHYVEDMAEILRDCPEIDYVQCGHYNLENGEITVGQLPWQETVKRNHVTTEQYLFNIECRASWSMMVRKSFMDKIGMIKNYYTDTRWSHEPYFFVPLSACGARIKSIRDPLYIYRVGVEDSHSYQNIKVDFERHKKYGESYFELVSRCLDGLDEQYCNSSVKDRIRRVLPLAKYNWYIDRYQILDQLSNCPEFVYMNFFNEIFNYFGVRKKRLDYLGNENNMFLSIRDFFLNNPFITKNRKINRVIVYGALGKRMHKIFPNLCGTPLEPHDFWDENGFDDKTPGVYAVKPDFDSLTESDLLLALPKALEDTDFYSTLPCRVLYMNDIMAILRNKNRFFNLGYGYACE
jgi:glycosyltransferase involved in cell wall biosynthesis